MTRRRRLLAGATLLFASACGMPEQPIGREALSEIPRVTRVVVRNVSPGVDPESPAGQPITIYRMGERWGRIEYPLNPEKGTQPLVVVNEPHAWMIDRQSGVGRYVLDPGPTYVFHAPIFDETGEDLPEALRALEFGSEFGFLERHGAGAVAAESANGVALDRYRVDLEQDLSVVIHAVQGTQVPVHVGVFRGGVLQTAYDYQSYRTDLMPRKGMFLPPEGTRIVKPEDARGSDGDAPR